MNRSRLINLTRRTNIQNTLNKGKLNLEVKYWAIQQDRTILAGSCTNAFNNKNRFWSGMGLITPTEYKRSQKGWNYMFNKLDTNTWSVGYNSATRGQTYIIREILEWGSNEFRSL